MDAPKGKPSAILNDRARGCSRDSASVQADKEKKPGEARPFFPSGLPHGCAPQGSLHRRGGELELMVTLEVQSHPPRRRMYAQRGEVAPAISSVTTARYRGTFQARWGFPTPSVIVP